MVICRAMTALLGRLPARASHREWAVLIFKGIVVLAAIVLLAATYINLEWTARSVGAIADLVGAQRAVDTHQSFYVGATDQDGPLSLVGYAIAYAIGGQQGAWFVIAAIVMLVAALIAGSAWITANRADDPQADGLVGGAAAIAFFIFLTLGPAEFQHTLSGRSIVALCFALALPLILLSLAAEDRRRKLSGVALAAVLVGFAVQTNLASAPTALVFVAFVGWLTLRGRFAESDAPGWAPVAIFACVAFAALISAIVWYTLRGDFSDFWTYWWDYARTSSEAMNNSLGILGDGIADFAGYYQAQPLQTVILILFGFDTAARMRVRDDASLNAFLFGWWLSGCFAVMLAQRFLDAYLILPAVAIGFMAVLLAARHGHRLPLAYRPGAVALIIIATLYISAGAQLSTAFNRLSDFRSPSSTQRAHVNALPYAQHVLHNAVAATSKPAAPVYAWTEDPSVYTTADRPAASRYAVSQWLRGEIPSARTAPEYVIKDGWQNWGADLRRTPPALWLELAGTPLPRDLPPLAKVRDCAFKLAYSDQFQHVYKRVRPIGPCLDRAGLKQLDRINAAARER
jgi:hypothetical protein